MRHIQRQRFPRAAIPILCLALLAPSAACGSKSAPSPAVTSVTVTGTALSVGSSSQFTAMATLSDGSTSTVTSQATWQASNPLVLTVTNTGLVTGVGDGSAAVSAIYQQVRGSVTVNVASSVCIYSVQPQQITVTGAGGSMQVQVTVMAGCPWTALSNAPFITVTAGSAGTGNGPVTFSVGANSGAPRIGTLTVAGLTVTVTQN